MYFFFMFFHPLVVHFNFNIREHFIYMLTKFFIKFGTCSLSKYILYCFIIGESMQVQGCGVLKTFYDVQQLLKKYGIIIYVGDRLGDIKLMEIEIRELYKLHLIDSEVFTTAILVLRQEMLNCKKM